MIRNLVGLVGLVAAASLAVAPRKALAHHLEESRLDLRPPKGGELRGRFLLAPRAFSPLQPGSEGTLTSELGEQVDLSVAGAPCTTPLLPVEVWTEASPSPGHLVDLRCPVPDGAVAPRVDVVWRGRSDLWVTYPPTETTAAVSLELSPGARGSFLATEVASSPAPVSRLPSQSPSPTELERPPAKSPVWLDLTGLSLLWLLLAKMSQLLDAHWAGADRRRRWLLRTATLSSATAGLALFVFRLLAA